MKRILRHQSDSGWAEFQLKYRRELFDETFGIIRQVKKVGTLDAIQKDARTIAAFQSVLAPNSPDIRTHLEYAARALTGLYRCAEKRGGTVEVDLGEAARRSSSRLPASTR